MKIELRKRKANEVKKNNFHRVVEAEYVYVARGVGQECCMSLDFPSMETT